MHIYIYTHKIHYPLAPRQSQTRFITTRRRSYLRSDCSNPSRLARHSDSDLHWNKQMRAFHRSHRNSTMTFDDSWKCQKMVHICYVNLGFRALRCPFRDGQCQYNFPQKPSTNLELVGCIPTPLKNMKVNWDDYSQYIW